MTEQTHPSATLGLFAWMCASVRAIIAPFSGSETARGRLVTFFHGYLNRAARRIEALFAKWRAGSLKPAPPRPNRAATARPRGLRLPQRRGWIIQHIQPAAIANTQLLTMLQDAEFTTFLAEVPAALRILRPLCTAFAVDLAGPLARAPRRRKPRPAHPAPKRGLYPTLSIRSYSPGQHARRRKKPV